MNPDEPIPKVAFRQIDLDGYFQIGTSNEEVIFLPRSLTRLGLVFLG